MFVPATPETPDLLAAWRWLVGGRPRLHGWSVAGDLFYIGDGSLVWRLDLGAGEAEAVADSAADFATQLAAPAAAAELLLLPVVVAFEAAQGPLAIGQCLGFRTLPVFGGAYTVENRYAVAVGQHAAFTGDVHRQIRDLPDGAQVALRVVP
jgi:hypothetical protein